MFVPTSINLLFHLINDFKTHDYLITYYVDLFLVDTNFLFQTSTMCLYQQICIRITISLLYLPHTWTTLPLLFINCFCIWFNFVYSHSISILLPFIHRRKSMIKLVYMSYHLSSYIMTYLLVLFRPMPMNFKYKIINSHVTFNQLTFCMYNNKREMIAYISVQLGIISTEVISLIDCIMQIQFPFILPFYILPFHFFAFSFSKWNHYNFSIIYANFWSCN